jgi:hypothetical protein
MRKNKVVPRTNAHHGNTLRTLDFQRIGTEDIIHRSTLILPNLNEKVGAMAIDDADVDKDSHDQVSLRFLLAFLVTCKSCML